MEWIGDGQGRSTPWDYGIKRIATGFGYYLAHRTRLKALVQLNNWDHGAPNERDYLFSLNWPAISKRSFSLFICS